MNEEKLVVGLPSGSLADPVRGGRLAELLKRAGFPTQGYEQGGPSRFPITPLLVGWDGRPQEFGAQLALGEIDVAIGGRDWIRERQLELRYEYGQEVQLTFVHSLDRGHVKVVVIVRAEAEGQSSNAYLKSLLSSKPLVTMVAEMPYLAYDWFRGKAELLGFGGSHKDFSVQKFITPPKIKRGVVIYETWGKTEAKVANGSVDLGVEIAQTGTAIRNYGLLILEEIMESETTVWASPRLKQNPKKYDLARMFLLNLFGSLNAENRVLVLFNARKEDQQRLLEYLQKNHLFSDEPTINEGVNFIEFSVQLDASNKDLPLARVRYELAKLGATAIETIALESSIPGLRVIEF